MRKSVWLALSNVYRTIGYEKALKQLFDAGIEEVYPIVATGGGTFYPSKYRPQHKEFEGKDIVTPFVKEAKKHGIKVHPWIVCMNFSHPKYVEQHKDLYVVSKEGVSCIDSPPYVPYYKWLCPSREENKENLANIFVEVASNFDVDGVHFDYIRLPDVILPKGLRSKYEGVPDEDVILPKFDFCYCNVCRRLFKEEYGVDPMKLKIVEPMYGKWFRWRADRITEIVKYVYRKVKNYDSSIEVSAAVFATPKLAYEYVFQDWPSWDIDLYNPMIYHKYYAHDHTWIGDAVREGVLKGVNLSAGMLIGFFEAKEHVAEAVKLSEENGAVGVTFFVYPPPRPELVEWIKESLKPYK